MSDKIEEIYAFIELDPKDGNEGITAFPINDMLFPLITADTARVDQLRPLAQHIANSTGRVIELRKFSKMEVLEVISQKGRT